MATPTLESATVQEIQLELIRRTTFNAFDGPTIHASLLRHRELWQAVLLDRPGVANYKKLGLLLTSGLIKLRDLDDNLWNADQLFILTKSRADADALARIAEEEDWAGDIIRYEDPEEISNSVGSWAGHGQWLLSIWWD